jgi:NAD(P)-dependent dehydrogenase (short-subunit alcohol dehydrogenase family)
MTAGGTPDGPALRGTVALVTGASSGIVAATAVGLAGRGARVARRQGFGSGLRPAIGLADRVLPDADRIHRRIWL